MVKIIDRIKNKYVHKSLYDMAMDELVLKRKKQIENKWLQIMNSLLAAVFGGSFFFYGYQHLAIIMYIGALIFLVDASSTDNYIQQIDVALFLKERTE